ncbi:MAG: FG-GAP repeat protein [Chloroflexi bacterium]|nr:FG-GAP repeat protein [Chloroflexota bacterium]
MTATVSAQSLPNPSQSLAICDFNGDGFDDLAIGSPHKGIGFVQDAGAVDVLYGSAAGLTPTDDQIWHQNTNGVEGRSEPGDLFGSALACGDFNGDSVDDLAIGAQREDIGPINDAGVVNVLYGSAAGLTATNDQIWHQNTNGVEGRSEPGDLFAAALASGDFNGDSVDDLAIGAPREDIGSIQDAGAVNVLYGSPSGLTATNDQLWHQDTNGVQGRAEPTDLFGSALACGDFNGDSVDDLAIGAPREDIGSIQDAGAVNVLYGSPSGPTAANNQIWHLRGYRGDERCWCRQCALSLPLLRVKGSG